MYVGAVGRIYAGLKNLSVYEDTQKLKRLF